MQVRNSDGEEENGRERQRKSLMTESRMDTDSWIAKESDGESCAGLYETCHRRPDTPRKKNRLSQARVVRERFISTSSMAESQAVAESEGD